MFDRPISNVAARGRARPWMRDRESSESHGASGRHQDPQIRPNSAGNPWCEFRNKIRTSLGTIYLIQVATVMPLNVLET